MRIKRTVYLCHLRRAGIAGIASALLAIVIGCASGSGEGLDASGRPAGETDDAPLTADFDSIQQQILTPNCAISGCHVGAAAPLGLRLDADSSFALLVGIPSVEVPALLRVDPGRPDDSYLIQKLEGTAAVGGRMPLNGPPFLAQSDIDVIRQWVSDGALAPGAASALPSVVAVQITTESNRAPAAIDVVFSHEMDPSLVGAATVQLSGSAVDRNAGAANEFSVLNDAIALANRNRRLLRIDLGNTKLPAGRYELRLIGTGPTALASVTGSILDGDRDGAPGGDFATVFEVPPPLTGHTEN